jgi:hypothetical protein
VDSTLQKLNYATHCLLLFDGDLKPWILDEILFSHEGQGVQSTVFLYPANTVTSNSFEGNSRLSRGNRSDTNSFAAGR